MTTKLDQLRSAIIERVPEIKQRDLIVNPNYDADSAFTLSDFIELIKLADVLYCLPNHAYSYQKGFIKFDIKQHYTRTAEYWNLTKDNLSLQSQPTIDFLHSILCKQ